MTRVDVVTRTLPPNEVSEANPWDTDRFWTVPNVLSVIRLIGVPIFLWLALGPRADGWAVAVLAVAGLTDWLDGRIAAGTKCPALGRCSIRLPTVSTSLQPLLP